MTPRASTASEVEVVQIPLRASLFPVEAFIAETRVSLVGI
jgi:hypothetical protein